MQSYEYKDEGSRNLCTLHHKLRCDECHFVNELLEENKLYRRAIAKAIEQLNNTEYFDVTITTATEVLEDVWEGTK